ncbi:HD family phosphohydrolase, partial [bacterium]
MAWFKWRVLTRKFLLGALKKVSSEESTRIVRKTDVLHKDIHIVTWLLALIIYVIFFAIFVYTLGFYYKTILAIFLYLTLTFMLIIIFMKRKSQELIKCDESITLMGFILVVFILLILFVKRHDFLHPLLTPLPAAAMIINILLGPFAALIVVLVTVTTMAIFYNYDFMIFFIMLIGSLTAIACTMNVLHRRDITKSALYVGIANVACIGMLKFLNSVPMPDILEQAGWGFTNGFFSAIITIGLLPYMESFFSITTNIRLLELADFTQPVLKQLMMEAPGTYHHSLIVGNLAEIAAREIGANALLVRVGAYYHDIGKFGKSEYFGENMPQHAVSKHDEITPNLSSLVILSHVKDGVTMAKKIKLDKAVIDIIEQHHGTSLIHYFYHKAQTGAKDTINEEKYRYPGPKPRSKEAAIIMLADSVEAATHSSSDFSHTHLKDTVTKIINNKFVDGQ